MIRYPIALLTIALLSLSACKQSSDGPADTPGLSLCTDPRPEICTQDYTPVCGVHEDGSRQTYSNGCSACSNVEVLGSLAGACPE